MRLRFWRGGTFKRVNAQTCKRANAFLTMVKNSSLLSEDIEWVFEMDQVLAGFEWIVRR
jgi:hypothetical protein